MNVAVGRDNRSKFQPDAEFLEGDGDRRETLSRLDYGKGEFATRQEARLFAVDCDQVRLCQNLQQVLGLQGFDHGAYVSVGTKEKDIQHVAD